MSDAAKIQIVASEPVPFARSFVASEAFRTLFREGMTLVETTAAYLDGPGREASRALGRDIALAYASESMRLTTRLMQIASWLLLQRAVSEGELSVEQARSEKRRVRLTDAGTPCPADQIAQLPETLRELIGHSMRLQARILLLEQQMETAPAAVPGTSPLQAQMDLLSSAFAARP